MSLATQVVEMCERNGTLFDSLPRRDYAVVYADPPWNGLGWNNGSGWKCPANHYAVQGEDWIRALPVSAISSQNCALFLWVTFPNLPAGLRVMESWGFRYATNAFTWVKRNRKTPTWFWGCGNYTRANAEICLLGMRGTLKRASASVHSVVDNCIGKHSEKPDVVRQRIVALFGDVPRVELFARQRTPGWDAWGNEV